MSLVKETNKFEWKSLIWINLYKLKLVGLWPIAAHYKNDFYTIWAILSILIFMVLHNFFQVVNIVFIFDDLGAVTSTFFITFSTMLSILKTYFVSHNITFLKYLINSFERKIFQPQNNRQKKIIYKSVEAWRFSYNIFWTLAISAILLWLAYPILDKSETRKLPFLAWYPYDAKKTPLYQLTYVHQIASISFIATVTLSIDNIIAVLNMFIGAQFDILCDNLRNLFSEDLENPINLYKKFNNIIKHHQTILR